MELPGQRSPKRIEEQFDAPFATALAIREKQIQQNYRPVIGVHKWFARRPGSIFRSLLLAEYGEQEVAESYWQAHQFRGVIGDPFMGGGTPLIEANRLGFHVVGCDVNPIAHWIVRQSLTPLRLDLFAEAAAQVIAAAGKRIRQYYRTSCLQCGEDADVKYFLWVKVGKCPECSAANDLFPGYRLAEAVRHPRHVLACPSCGELAEFETPPSRDAPVACLHCKKMIHVEGPVARNRCSCSSCGASFAPAAAFAVERRHRMWAIEYNCGGCYPSVVGRQFKKPDDKDLSKFAKAERLLLEHQGKLSLPDEAIPAGDETDRLHRWGYKEYRQLFNSRQLFSLGILANEIRAVDDNATREALATVFSDTLRYQNMLCRYDTYALKCQDIFSVHGFPVGLVQCENNVLGITSVGSGSFCHFVEKYLRAKQYCAAPFEIRYVGKRKQVVKIPGETISAEIISGAPSGLGKKKQALLRCVPAWKVRLTPGTLDGVFTDPPYFDNVQYAELMDFCFVWLRKLLGEEHPQFRAASTRSPDELTGNATLSRGLQHFAEGLSAVFCNFAGALKDDAPFVFTYHHNDPVAYGPLVIAILDAGLTCTATLPAAAEMSASLHISGTESSILDSVFVCRGRAAWSGAEDSSVRAQADLVQHLSGDSEAMREGGVQVSAGDLRCLAAGHLARSAIADLRSSWDSSLPVVERMRVAQETLATLVARIGIERAVSTVLRKKAPYTPEQELLGG